MTDHIKMQELISAWLDGEVTPSERAEVEQHIKECPACAKLAQEWRTLSSSLKKWPDEVLSPDLEQKIQQRLRHPKSKEESMETQKLVGIALTICIVIACLLHRNDTYTQLSLGSRIRTVSSEELRRQELKRYSQAKQEPYYIQLHSTDDRNKKTEPTQLAQLQDSKDYLSERGYILVPEKEKKAGNEPQAVMNAGFKAFPDRETLAKSAVSSKFRNDLSDQFSPGNTGAVKTARLAQGKVDMYEPYYLQSNYKVSRTKELKQKGNENSPASSIAESEAVLFAQTPPMDLKDNYGVYGYEQQLTANTEQYDQLNENQFKLALDEPLSTFSIDVDTASYANIRRFINNGQLPPKDAVRIEEMINYFKYDYPQPNQEVPFTVTTEAAVCPWNKKHILALIGLQGKNIDTKQLPPSNLVFLIDVSGSMDEPNKLPLLKSSFKLLVKQLRPEDHVAIVVYAGNAGLVLETTPGNEQARINNAIDNLQAGGSTAGGAGIQLAYKIAKDNFIASGNNRVILATDGDFNVGVSSDDELVKLIEEKRDQGIFLTVLGFGTGNYKDSKMEKLADKGNGNYAYIDNILEGEKVFVQELSSTLLTIAKDVKIQIEFNPGQVKAYRLIGYENRMLAKEDFNDDRKDAGEIGAGHSVTALYEIVPADSDENFNSVDPLKYQKSAETSPKPTITPSDDWMTVKLRYKEPQEQTSKLLTEVVSKKKVQSDIRSNNLNFASAVAEFGLLLRDSSYKGEANYSAVLERGQHSVGADPQGYRAEFLKLVKMAQMLGEGGQ